MKRRKYDVFISYRRDTGSFLARDLHDYLTRRGYHVFFDREPYSGPFNTSLYEVIESAPDFVLICTNGTFDRCKDPNDWVRNEIRHALEVGANIVPVQSENFVFPHDLPDDIKEVCGMNGPQASMQYTDAFKDKLCDYFVGPKPISRRSFFVGLLVLVGAAAALGAYKALADGAAANAEVSLHASRALPYTKAGYYVTSEELSSQSVESSSLPVDKAFSILTFLVNEGEGKGIVESIRMDVASLEAIEEPCPQALGGIDGTTMSAFVLNNGWGAFDADLEAFACGAGPDERVVLSDVCTSIEALEHCNIRAGQVTRAFGATFDVAKFLKYSHMHWADIDGIDKDYLEVKLVSSADGEERDVGYWVVAHSDEKGFEFYYDGFAPNQPYAVTLFGLLDIDENPTSIHFTGTDSTPLVEDVTRIETVVAPTKSCRLVCKDVFSFRNKEIETDEYEFEVTVPLYDDVYLVEKNSPFVEALMTEPDSDGARLTELAAPFRYDPKSLLEEALTEEALREFRSSTNKESSI